MRWAMTRVLPEPGPARISSGPSACVTAASWAGLRPSVTDMYVDSSTCVRRKATAGPVRPEPRASTLEGGMAYYEFETDWRLRAPLLDVWNAIAAPDRWPQWWDGVVAAELVRPGNGQGIGAVRRLT